MRDIVKPGIVLFIVTLIASICLGLVYNITLEPIALQKEKTQKASMTALLPEATDFKEDIIINEGDKAVKAYTGYAGEEVVGYIIAEAPKGYSGEIEMLVGIDPEGTIAGVQIIDQNETPGLGSKCKDPEFIDQYKGKTSESPLVVGKNGSGDIDAITSSTITSDAVTLGVNDALEFYNNNIK